MSSDQRATYTSDSLKLHIEDKTKLLYHEGIIFFALTLINF